MSNERERNKRERRKLQSAAAGPVVSSIGVERSVPSCVAEILRECDDMVAATERAYAISPAGNVMLVTAICQTIFERVPCYVKANAERIFSMEYRDQRLAALSEIPIKLRPMVEAAVVLRFKDRADSRRPRRHEKNP